MVVTCCYQYITPNGVKTGDSFFQTTICHANLIPGEQVKLNFCIVKQGKVEQSFKRISKLKYELSDG
jgi:hypothetical protein